MFAILYIIKKIWPKQLCEGMEIKQHKKFQATGN